jgi:hypothetical protein
MSLFTIKFLSSAISAALITATVPIFIHWTARQRKSEASLKDGWYYLEPSFMAWFVLVASGAFPSITLLVVLINLAQGVRPTFDAGGIIAIGLVFIFVGGFGAAAIATYISCFHTKVRWNVDAIEKVTCRATKRIAWNDVQLYGYDAVLGYFWISSQNVYLRISSSMHGVHQLLIKLAGEEKGTQLYQQSM